MLNNGIIRQSSAVDILVGPFLEGSDGTTTMDALALEPDDILVSKAGGVPAAKNEGSNASPQGDGLYIVSLDAVDTAAAGELVVAIPVAGAIFVRHSFCVVEEDVYDALYAPGAAGWPATAAGARTVVVTVDDGTDPVPNAQVRVQNGNEIYIEGTNSLGQAFFNLNDATWTVAIAKPGLTFTEAVLVVDSDVNPTYSTA